MTTETTAQRPANCDPLTDPQRCRQSIEALATVALIATDATRTTRSVYGDVNWPDRPTTVATTSVSGGTNERIESFVYDAATGRLLQTTVQGWSGSPWQQQTRTTTNTWNDGSQGAPFDPDGTFEEAWVSLPQPRATARSHDGPRTDVSDVTQRTS